MGPNCSSCCSSFQVGRGGASGAPDSALVSVSTQQWLPRDLQVIKGQKSKRLIKRMERSKIRANGKKAAVGNGAGETYWTISSSPNDS